jgi:cell wall-associated NlpC family hydrolase
VKPYFTEENPMHLERVKKLQFEAERWIGTPFVAHSMVRRAGVDCVHLAAALYITSGALKDFQPPRYALDGGQHNQESQVLGWLKRHPGFANIYCREQDGKNVCRLHPGDLLCFKLSFSEHHVGVMLTPVQFIHARYGKCVEICSLTDPVYKRCLTAAFRPLGVAA